MTTLEIARIAEARMTTKGWSALCPAHADRSPSLSICEGRGGRTLLRCFAGCSAHAIARALGLGMSDLFVNDRRIDRGYSGRPTPGAADIEAALRAECSRIMEREAERVGSDVAELTRHRNEARAVIERRFGVSLKRESPRWAELEPHCIDPAWKACVDQALHVAAAHSRFTFETFRKTVAALPKVRHRVLLLARQLQRELAIGAAA